ncbi:MAG: hypothetical protein R3A51_08105 [Nannocystaceae bacterium]
MVRSLARGSMITGASLTLLALLATLALLRRERVLAVLLGAIDPRPLARFRVAIGCLLLINAVSLHAHGELLFSNEGLLSTVGGRFGSARAQFDDLVTPGLATLLKYPAGTSWSLLHFWDPPLAVHLHFALLYLACLGLILGKWTGVAKWTALVVYLAIWARDDLSFSGERVLTVSLLLLCLSDCGAALSLDARDRPLRPIPRWPQVLLVLQLIPIYLGNAIARTDLTWLDGHAVHYAVTTSQPRPLAAPRAPLAPCRSSNRQPLHAHRRVRPGPHGAVVVVDAAGAAVAAHAGRADRRGDHRGRQRAAPVPRLRADRAPRAAASAVARRRAAPQRLLLCL